MNYNQDNIVGIKFTHPVTGNGWVYEIKSITQADNTVCVVVTWGEGKESVFSISDAIGYLNNGTWNPQTH